MPELAVRSTPVDRGVGLLGTPWSEVRLRDDGRMVAQLSGALPQAWTLRLAQGLAGRGLGLRNGFARSVEPGVWLAELEIESPSRDGVPELDLLELAARAHPAPEPPRILDFELSESRSLGGSLDLEVDAWDAVGLLATVLDRVDQAGLAPAEMILETQEDCAFHHLTLLDRSWGQPSTRQRRALAIALAALLCRR